ncbi:MAG: Gfo/Idh/MocA family protein [Acidobacteriota bacterium]
MLRIGVIGVGAWGRNHAEVYAALPDVRLEAVVDVDARRATEAGAAFEATALQSAEELIGRVDAVSIAVPTRDHARLGVLFLEHGIHVLVEKPICRTLEEADRLIAAAQASDCVLQVGQLERFNPAFIALAPLVKEPRFFEADRLNTFTPRSLDIDVVLDLMIHDLDLIGSLVAAPVAEVRAVGIPILTPRVDIANARIEFADGTVANVTASRVSLERTRKLRFFQAHDYISLDFQSHQVLVASLVKASNLLGKEVRTRYLEVGQMRPLEAELRSFVGAIEGRNPVVCPGQEARRALEMALAVQRQMKMAAYEEV